MPTLSVKLPEETKDRLDRLAASKGITPHAVMVAAIESALESQERHGAFVEAALQSRDETVASGKAYDGDEVIAYLRSRAKGTKAARPALKSMKSLIRAGK